MHAQHVGATRCVARAPLCTSAPHEPTRSQCTRRAEWATHRVAATLRAHAVCEAPAGCRRNTASCAVRAFPCGVGARHRRAPGAGSSAAAPCDAPALLHPPNGQPTGAPVLHVAERRLTSGSEPGKRRPVSLQLSSKFHCERSSGGKMVKDLRTWFGGRGRRRTARRCLGWAGAAVHDFRAW